jgi:hypothetical protein
MLSVFSLQSKENSGRLDLLRVEGVPEAVIEAMQFSVCSLQ